MTNKSKNIGTKWESDLVKWLQISGFPDAKRNVLGGANDPGDVEPIPGAAPLIIISAKSGYGKDVHPDTRLFSEWWEALNRTVRRRNSGNGLGMLCHKREGKSSPRYAHWFVAYRDINFGRHTGMPFLGPVKITGTQALRLMFYWKLQHSGKWPTP